MNQALFINARFASVWDGGYYIITNCRVNTATKEVFDIETSDVPTESLSQLDRELIILDDGQEFPVSCISDDSYQPKPGEYWYKL